MDWDATDGRNGGTQQQCGKFCWIWKDLLASKGRISSSLGIGLGPGEGLRAGQSSCGVGLGDALQLPKEDLASAVRVLRAPEERVQFEGICGGAAPDHHGHPARVQVELFASAYFVAGCIK